MQKMETISLRLKPGQDLKRELDHLAQAHDIEAACVLACVGSLTTAVLRYANQPQSSMLTGHFEIVSLTGTLSKHGSHYHISISDGEGRTYGAHLLEGCRSISLRSLSSFLMRSVLGFLSLRSPTAAVRSFRRCLFFRATWAKCSNYLVWSCS